MLQNAIGKENIDTARPERQVLNVGADIVGSHSHLPRHATRGFQGIDVNIHSNGNIASLSRSDGPSPPAAAHINQQPSLAAFERPVGYRITLEPAPCWPIEVSIGIYEPISHERVYGAVRVQVRARFHVPGNWFAADMLSENGGARF